MNGKQDCEQEIGTRTWKQLPSFHIL